MLCLGRVLAIRRFRKGNVSSSFTKLISWSLPILGYCSRLLWNTVHGRVARVLRWGVLGPTLLLVNGATLVWQLIFAFPCLNLLINKMIRLNQKIFKVLFYSKILWTFKEGTVINNLDQWFDFKNIYSSWWISCW